MNRNVRPPAWGNDTLVIPPALKVTTLGGARRVWAGNPKALTIPLVLATLGLLLAVTCGGALLRSGADAFGLLVPIGIGLLSAFLGLYTIVRLRTAASAVVEYDAGIAVLVGSRCVLCAWSEIATIVSDERMISGQRSASPMRRYELTKQNGQRIVLLDDKFEDVEAIMKPIKAHAAHTLLPALQSAYDAGQRVTFGPVAVSKQAIYNGGREIAWGSVSTVAVKDGRLVITPKDGTTPVTVRASRIPNIEQLGAVIGVDPSAMELLYF